MPLILQELSESNLFEVIFCVASETFCLVAKGRPPLAKDRAELQRLVSGATRGKATLRKGRTSPLPFYAGTSVLKGSRDVK